MSFYARPAPTSPEAEIARIDADLRLQSHRLKTADLGEREQNLLRAVIDGLFGRRHNLTSIDQEN